MAATRPGVMDGAGHGVHLAPLLCGETGSNQRAAGHAGLDHQHAKGQTADNAVTPREVGGLGPGVQRKLRYHGATVANHCVCQCPMALWIKFFQARPQNPHCLPANVQSSLMRCAINPQRQPAGNHKTGASQAAGKGGRGVQPRPRSASATDHRQLRFFQS